MVALASKCFGQAKLDPGITLAHSIKIALRIVGMHDGDPTSATNTTCGARLSLFVDQTLRASSNYLLQLQREAAMNLLVSCLRILRV